MKNTLIYLIIFSSTSFSHNITNTLQTGRLFQIRDNTNSFFTLNQSNGTIDLIGELAGSQQWAIFKGAGRFIHRYYGTETRGSNTFVGMTE